MGARLLEDESAFSPFLTPTDDAGLALSWGELPLCNASPAWLVPSSPGQVFFGVAGVETKILRLKLLCEESGVRRVFLLFVSRPGKVFSLLLFQVFSSPKSRQSG